MTGDVVIGTAAYMSPEQAQAIAADRRADVWPFGVVLHELLSGRKAFDAATVPETLVASAGSVIGNFDIKRFAAISGQLHPVMQPFRFSQPLLERAEF